jgi:hypothetical protein
MTVGSIPGMGSIPKIPGSRFFLMTEATMAAVRTFRSIKTCLARSNMRARGHRIQPPGVTQRTPVRPNAARGGSFGIDTHGHRSDFCESAVFTIVL